jgi:hypothetical protein
MDVNGKNLVGSVIASRRKKDMANKVVQKQKTK